MPRVSPGKMSKETSSTARTTECSPGRTPRLTSNHVFSPRTSSSGWVESTFRGGSWLSMALARPSVAPPASSPARTQADTWSRSIASSGGGAASHAVLARGASRGEAAAGRRVEQARRQPLDGLELRAARAVQARHRAQQPDRVRMQRAREDVRGRGLLDHARRIHHVHAVGIAGHDPQVVRDHHHRDAQVARQRLHQLQDLRLDGDVERGGRLVGDDRASGCRRAPMAIITRWRMPPENWCGILPEAPFRVGDADQLQQFQRPRAGRLLAPCSCG